MSVWNMENNDVEHVKDVKIHKFPVTTSCMSKEG